MTGDANAAAYRLYSSTRADQRGGARPDPKNCTLEVACRLFQNAYNKGTAIRNRMMLSVIHTCTSYSLASAHMKSWLNNSCTKVLDHINDTIVMVVFDNARNHTHMDQRIAQEKEIVKWHRLNSGLCEDDGSDCPADVTQASNFTSHTSEVPQHTDNVDHFYKDFNESNGAWLKTTGTGNRVSRQSTDSHMPMIVFITP